MDRFLSAPIPPGSCIGIVGGGQLGRMSAHAAQRLGYHTYIFTPESGAPATQVSSDYIIADYMDEKALQRFADHVDVVSYEFENIPVQCVRFLEQSVPVFPGAELLEVTQHRVQEKKTIQQLGIATAPFAHVRSLQDMKHAASEIGLPAVLKTCCFGYDGKGQAIVRSESDLQSAFQKLDSTDLILEGFVPFKRELSVIVARSALDGSIVSYPLVENIHRDHILHKTIVPAPDAGAELEAQAMHIARTLAEGLNLVGLMAIELFETEDGTLLVNELAPRPHNSGHWSMDASMTSQFEQHIRAITGLPLGSADIVQPCEMVNLIGDECEQWLEYLSQPQAKLHLYGKQRARIGRKMGHVNLLQNS